MKQKLCPKVLIPGFGHFRRSTLLMVLFEERLSKNFKVQKTNGGKFHLKLFPLDFHLLGNLGLRNLSDIESLGLWEGVLQKDPLHYPTGKL